MAFNVDDYNFDERQENILKYYTADFETTTDPNDCRVWAYCLCDIDDIENVIYGNSIEKFIDWCKTARRIFHPPEKRYILPDRIPLRRFLFAVWFSASEAVSRLSDTVGNTDCNCIGSDLCSDPVKPDRHHTAQG